MHCNVVNERRWDKGLRNADYSLYAHSMCIVSHSQTRSTVQIEIFKYQPENGFSIRWTSTFRLLALLLVCLLCCSVFFCARDSVLYAFSMQLVCSFTLLLSLSRIHIFYSSACFATAHLSISKLICHLRALHFMYVFHIICNVISSVIEWDAKLLYVCVVVVIVIVIVHGFENEAKFDFCYWQMNCSNTIWNILISIH